MVPVLREVVAEHPGVTVVEADATTVDWSALLAASPSWTLVANLPYNVATPLLVSDHTSPSRRSAVPASPTAHIASPTPAIQCSCRVPGGSATSDHALPSQRSITPTESAPAPRPPPT